jgi:hypothetical protein
VETAVKALEREIRELEEQLERRRTALAELTGTPIATDVYSQRKRFSPPMRAHRAAYIYLEEMDKAVSQKQIIDALEAEGACDGKKRGRHNVRISLEKSIENGTFLLKNGLIGLAGWSEDKFKG